MNRNPASVTTIAAKNYWTGGIQPVAGVTFVKLSGRENARTGTETTIVFEGDYIPIKNQQAFNRKWGVFQQALDRMEGATRYQLTATFPLDEEGREPVNLSGVYELDIELSQPSVYCNPVLRGTKDIDGNVLTPTLLPDDAIALVARVVSNFQAGDYSMTNTVGGSPVTDGGWSKAIADIKAGITNSNYQARAIQLFATVAALQTTSYVEETSVLRRTITVALPGQAEATYEGAGEIWTSSEVSIWENISPDGWFQLDPNMQWRKSKPQVIVAAGQKTQIAYTYTEFKQANGLLYKPYASAKLLYADVTDLPPGA